MSEIECLMLRSDFFCLSEIVAELCTDKEMCIWHTIWAESNKLILS